MKKLQKARIERQNKTRENINKWTVITWKWFWHIFHVDLIKKLQEVRIEHQKHKQVDKHMNENLIKWENICVIYQIYIWYIYFVNLVKTSLLLRRATAVNEIIFFLWNSASNSRLVKNKRWKIEMKNEKEATKIVGVFPFCSFAKYFRLGLDRLAGTMFVNLSGEFPSNITGYWVC